MSDTESYNGPHPIRTRNAEATIEAAMRYPTEWQEGYEDGLAYEPRVFHENPESGPSRAYLLGRTAGDLERLRAALKAESISWGELAELQGLEAWIDPGDPELLEAAGVPEYTDDSDVDYGDGTALEVTQRSEVEPFDLATIDTERNMRYVVHPFVSSEPYVNYCGLCALSTSDHIPGPDWVDPLEAEDDLPTDEPDPDAMYDAARDEAHNLAVEDGKPDSWRDYMPGGVSWGRA